MAVLLVLAVRYGMAVGVVGSIISAVIFAHVLYSPLGSWHVTDHMARQNLAWMILGGVALSFLFAPSDSRQNRFR